MNKWVFLVMVLLAVASVSGMQEKTICLDPGHGGSDPGAVKVIDGYQLLEKDINLDVALRLKSLLEQDGANVVMTREDTYTELGNSDRAYICNDAGADLLISIHTNSVSDSTVDGSYMYYFKSEDKALAQIMQPIMQEDLSYYQGTPVQGFTDFGIDKFASGTLMKSDMPAVITEPVFMSNDLEASWILYGTRKDEIVQTHYRGIVAYFNQTPEEGSDDSPGNSGNAPGKNK